MLDHEATVNIILDSLRSIEITPSVDRETIVLSVEDPVSISLVELTQSELAETIAGLKSFLKDGGGGHD